MQIKHVALVCSSENNSDLFYRDLLRLDKQEPKMLPSGLSKQLFNLNRDLEIINYTGNGCHFEIFIDPLRSDRIDPISHTCLQVDDKERFVEDCRDAGVTVKQVKKGNGFVTFVEDPDGNGFEIKSALK